MAIATLTKRQLDASPKAAALQALAGGRPTPPVILALDLGQRTGWAVRNRDGAIASGVHEFRPSRFEGGGMIWLRFRAWLQEIDKAAGKVGIVLFEEVVAHRGVAASHCYAGFLAHLTAWAEANKIPYQGVPVGTIKRHIAGKGNADKEAVFAAVKTLGFDPTGRQRGRRAGAAALGDRAGNRRRAMTDRMVLRLSETWAVLADDRQWMLCRRRTPAHGTWKPLSYVASSKAVLLRCLREKGVIIDAHGQAALDVLPESFREWQREMTRPANEAPVPEPATAGHAHNWVSSSSTRDAAHPTSRPVPQIWPLTAVADTTDGKAAR